MQPASSRRVRRPAMACAPKKSRPIARPAHRFPPLSFRLLYLALFTAEAFLLGFSRWSVGGIWPGWGLVSIVFANLFFALIAGHHHSNKASKQMPADILLAAASLLALTVLTILVISSASGPALLIYAWLCAFLVNILRYYPARPWKTRQRR